MAKLSVDKMRNMLENKFSNGSLKEWQVTQLSEAKSDQEARCFLQTWLQNNYTESLEDFSCPTIWDGVHCWSATLPGKIIRKTCTEIFQETRPEYAPHLQGTVKRECLSDGTWAEGNQSDFTECTDSFESYLDGMEEDHVLVPMVHHMLFFGSIVSLLCLLVSLGIFYHYRSLHCDRVTVHAHLMLVLVLRFVLMFIITEPFVVGHSSSYRDVSFLCESILVLFLYSTFASVSWMFIQGLYLNLSLMVGTVSTSNRYQLIIYYIIGWGVPAVFVTVYVISMALKDQEACWNGYSKMKEMWILMGPMAFELVVNGLFLLNILRILLRKVRNSHSRADSSQIKAAAKATLILFPVLGINNLILLYNPGGDYNKYFVTLNTFFASTQGIFVAIVYCFADKDTRDAIQRSIERAKARRIGNPNRGSNWGLSLITIVEWLICREKSPQGSNNLENV